MPQLRVAGIAGSLRKDSYNKALLRAAVELAPEEVTIEPADISEIPLYDGDVEAAGIPETVGRLLDRIRGADALLIVTPEYNYSVPGVLKNVIDWASRPPDRPLSGKPAALMGASPGLYGTMRAQAHLRQVALATNMLVLGKPEVYVGQAGEKFSQGNLTDEATRKRVAELLAALRDWTLRLSGGRQP